MPDNNQISVEDVMAYEQGELGEQETIVMFQKLINSGDAWRLQGHYGRTARDLIQAGLCTQATPVEQAGGNNAQR